jgi:putative Ig domain-containing protein
MSIRRPLCAAALVLVAVFASTASSTAAAGPRVSVISDSILTSVTWVTGPALDDLSNGFDMQVDVGVCRRLNVQSCDFNGGHVPTTLDVINRWSAQLGSVVVIVDGYNDIPANFAGDVELTLDTLRNDGVQHVLWVDLYESRPEFAAKNAVLFAAAKRHPELRVLDWNTYSAGHRDWYQDDLIHLMPAGGVAIATWLHQAIAAAFAPAPAPPVALTVPAKQRMRARVGVPFRGQLAGAGAAALRWRTAVPTLRKARLHLSATGAITGVPSRAGRFSVPLTVSGAGGASERVTVSITVRRG